MRVVPGNHPGLPEYFESIDQRQGSCKEGCLDQQWSGDIPETLELSRSIYPSRDFSRYRLPPAPRRLRSCSYNPAPVHGNFSKYDSGSLPGQRRAARKAPQRLPALPWEEGIHFLKNSLFSPVFPEEGRKKGKDPAAGEDRSEEIFLYFLPPT